MAELVLGIDTCTRWLNLALVDASGEVAGEFHQEVPTHTTRLVPELDALLRRCGAQRSDLAAVGAVVGPGSFTGLRVGLAAALGIHEALGVPAFGLESLTALASAAGGEGEGIALLDARRSQVYARRFRKSGSSLEALGETRAAAPRDLLEEGRTPDWAAGDGVRLVPEWPASTVLVPEIPNLAVPAARKALQAVLASAPSEELVPLYVRPPDARKG